MGVGTGSTMLPHWMKGFQTILNDTIQRKEALYALYIMSSSKIPTPTSRKKCWHCRHSCKPGIMLKLYIWYVKTLCFFKSQFLGLVWFRQKPKTKTHLVWVRKRSFLSLQTCLESSDVSLKMSTLVATNRPSTLESERDMTCIVEMWMWYVWNVLLYSRIWYYIRGLRKRTELTFCSGDCYTSTWKQDLLIVTSAPVRARYEEIAS